MTVEPLKRTFPATASPAARAQLARDEARVLANYAVDELIIKTRQLAVLAAEVAALGDLALPGVRDYARRWADTCTDQAQAIEAIQSRELKK